MYLASIIRAAWISLWVVPPCEGGFSQKNRRHEVILPGGKRTFTRNPLDNDDARNDLFRYFLALVDILRPRMVLIENVPQMVSSRKRDCPRNPAYAGSDRLPY